MLRPTLFTFVVPAGAAAALGLAPLVCVTVLVVTAVPGAAQRCQQENRGVQ